MTKPLCILALSCLSFLIWPHAALGRSFIEGDLPRRADLGFRFSTADALIVTRVSDNSPATKAGLRPDDRITHIGNRKVRDLLKSATKLRRHRGGEALRLRVARGSENMQLTFTPPAKALENIPGVDSYYGVVDLDDDVRLRTIVASPEDAQGPRPSVFFVQWVSCGSLEYNPRSGSSRVQERLIRDAGWTLIRVERSASGDSLGPACHELDYDTEFEHYAEAFRQLKNDPRVDAEQIVIFGSSLGSTLAPLLAERLLNEGHKIAGVMVQGGGAVTYFERMLNFERLYLERQQDENGSFFDPAAIHDEFLTRSLFYTEYFLKGRHPDAIAKDSDAMARVRNTIRGLGKREQYGRPFAWHQQAAQHNFLKAWQHIDAPVLVVFNEYEQFESRHGHKLIVDMVNRLRPGSATFVEQAQMGHSNYRYADAVAAYNDRDGQQDPDSFADHLIAWLNSLEQTPRSK